LASTLCRPLAAGTPAAALAFLSAAAAAGEPVVVHCWGGGGRTGLVLAAWLCRQHGLTPEAAAQEVADFAKARGVSRRVDLQALTTFLQAAGAPANA